MSRNRGKRGSLSQNIGDKAEHRFGARATDRPLNATLVRKDYGLDFICQIFSEGAEIHFRGGPRRGSDGPAPRN